MIVQKNDIPTFEKQVNLITFSAANTKIHVQSLFTICENKLNTRHCPLTFIKMLSLATNTTHTNNWEQRPESETVGPKLTLGNYSDFTAPAVFSLNNAASARSTRQDSHFMSLWKQSVCLLSVIETTSSGTQVHSVDIRFLSCLNS